MEDAIRFNIAFYEFIYRNYATNPFAYFSYIPVNETVKIDFFNAMLILHENGIDLSTRFLKEIGSFTNSDTSVLNELLQADVNNVLRVISDEVINIPRLLINGSVITTSDALNEILQTDFFKALQIISKEGIDAYGYILNGKDPSVSKGLHEIVKTDFFNAMQILRENGINVSTRLLKEANSFTNSDTSRLNEFFQADVFTGLRLIGEDVINVPHLLINGTAITNSDALNEILQTDFFRALRIISNEGIDVCSYILNEKAISATMDLNILQTAGSVEQLTMLSILILPFANIKNQFCLLKEKVLNFTDKMALKIQGFFRNIFYKFPKSFNVLFNLMHLLAFYLSFFSKLSFFLSLLFFSGLFLICNLFFSPGYSLFLFYWFFSFPTLLLNYLILIFDGLLRMGQNSTENPAGPLHHSISGVFNRVNYHTHQEYPVRNLPRNKFLFLITAGITGTWGYDIHDIRFHSEMSSSFANRVVQMEPGLRKEIAEQYADKYTQSLHEWKSKWIVERYYIRTFHENPVDKIALESSHFMVSGKKEV
jgi:glutaredoxin-related protein